MRMSTRSSNGRNLNMVDNVAQYNRFHKIFGLMGGYADGYKKLKAIIKILEDKLLPEDRYKWDRELFGPESTSMLGDLLYSITRFDVDCILDCGKLKEQPIHHNYSMTMKGLNSFMNRRQAYLDDLPEETDRAELMSEFAVWSALPSSCAVTYVMLNKDGFRNNGSNGSNHLEMLINDTKLKRGILTDITNWYRDLGFKANRHDSSIKLYVTEETIGKINARYEYLRINEIQKDKVEKDMLMVLATLKHIYDSESDYEDRIKRKLQEKLEYIESTKDKLNRPLDERIDMLGKIFSKMQESESAIVLKFGQKPQGLMLSLGLEHKNGFKTDEMLYVWHILQPTEAYSLFKQMPYKELKNSLQNG